MVLFLAPGEIIAGLLFPSKISDHHRNFRGHETHQHKHPYIHESGECDSQALRPPEHNRDMASISKKAGIPKSWPRLRFASPPDKPQRSPRPSSGQVSTTQRSIPSSGEVPNLQRPLDMPVDSFETQVDSFDIPYARDSLGNLLSHEPSWNSNSSDTVQFETSMFTDNFPSETARVDLVEHLAPMNRVSQPLLVYSINAFKDWKARFDVLYHSHAYHFFAKMYASTEIYFSNLTAQDIGFQHHISDITTSVGGMNKLAEYLNRFTLKDSFVSTHRNRLIGHIREYNSAVKPEHRLDMVGCSDEKADILRHSTRDIHGPDIPSDLDIFTDGYSGEYVSVADARLQAQVELEIEKWWENSTTIIHDSLDRSHRSPDMAPHDPNQPSDNIEVGSNSLYSHNAEDEELNLRDYAEQEEPNPEDKAPEDDAEKEEPNLEENAPHNDAEEGQLNLKDNNAPQNDAEEEPNLQEDNARYGDFEDEQLNREDKALLEAYSLSLKSHTLKRLNSCS